MLKLRIGKCLDIWAIHNHIHQIKKVATYSCGHDILDHPARPEPDCLVWVRCAHPTQHMQNPGHVLGLTRIAPKQGKPLNCGLSQSFKNRTELPAREGLPVLEVLSLSVEAPRTCQGASRDKQAHASPWPILCVEQIEARVIHIDTRSCTSATLAELKRVLPRL